MRRLLGLSVVVCLVAVPASVASVDPRIFVLSQADVPRGYMFDESNSLLITRAIVDAAPGDEGGQALARAGFVNGYFARYTNYGPPHWRYVNSAAYAFRQPSGARRYLLWMMKSAFAKVSGPKRVGLGDEAWLYTMTSPDTGTSVLWRHGRVVAWVSCLEMARHRSLALAQAHKQQRRIAAQLS